MNFGNILNPIIEKRKIQSFHEQNPAIIELYNTILSHIKESIDEENKVKQLQPSDDKFLRISTLTGGCMRKDFYERVDDIPDAQSETDLISLIKMAMGTANHEKIQQWLVRILHGVEERYNDTELMVTGGNDGIFTVNNALFELKTVGFTTFHYYCKNQLAKKDHIRQINAYIYLRNQKYKDDPNYVPIDKGYIIYWNRNLEPSFGSPEDEVNWQSLFAQIDTWEEMGLPDLIKIFEVHYSEELLEKEKEIVEIHWDKIAKGKKPPKTTKAYLCSGCKFAERCIKKVKEKDINNEEIVAA